MTAENEIEALRIEVARLKREIDADRFMTRVLITTLTFKKLLTLPDLEAFRSPWIEGEYAGTEAGMDYLKTFNRLRTQLEEPE